MIKFNSFNQILTVLINIKYFKHLQPTSKNLKLFLETILTIEVLKNSCWCRTVLDWDYYIERLSGTIMKIITIPAALQVQGVPINLKIKCRVLRS